MQVCGRRCGSLAAAAATVINTFHFYRRDSIAGQSLNMYYKVEYSWKIQELIFLVFNSSNAFMHFILKRTHAGKLSISFKIGNLIILKKY